MRIAVSRRGFLLTLAGGVTSASLVWGLWKSNLWTHRLPDRHPVAPCCEYVDYAGWLLTKTDKAKLTAAGSIKLLEATMLEGDDIADEVLPDVSACSSWCLTEANCKGFTYAAPQHSDPSKRSRCWLKGSGQISPVPNKQFTSGVR